MDLFTHVNDSKWRDWRYDKEIKQKISLIKVILISIINRLS